jgi:hypothetical protein
MKSEQAGNNDTGAGKLGIRLALFETTRLFHGVTWRRQG